MPFILHFTAHIQNSYEYASICSAIHTTDMYFQACEGLYGTPYSSSLAFYDTGMNRPLQNFTSRD